MQITMRNDCDHEEVCCPKRWFHHECSIYTSGQIHSIHLYSYGNLYVVARTAKFVEGELRGNHDVWSCISFRRMYEGSYEPIHMGISMCFPSQNPSVVMLMYRAGDIKW